MEHSYTGMPQQRSLRKRMMRQRGVTTTTLGKFRRSPSFFCESPDQAELKTR